MLVIQRRISIPTIGTWNWSRNDYKIPLVFNLPDAEARLYIESTEGLKKRKREAAFDALLQIIIISPTKTLIRAMGTSGKEAKRAADKIYAYYIQVIDQFEQLLITAGKVKYLFTFGHLSKEEFFEQDCLSLENVTWKIDDEAPLLFMPKIQKRRRKYNVLFQREQLITTKKWEDMQAAIGKKDFPSGEVLELLRLRSQLDWRGKRTVALEAAIFVEKLMRDYAHNIILTKLRRSKRYLDNIKRELNLFTILNIMLPMSLPKSDEKRLEKHIRAIDNLRKLRNDIMHGKIDESDIDEREVRASIESTLKILDFIDSKKKKAASSSN